MINETIATLFWCSVCRSQQMYFDPERDAYVCAGCGNKQIRR